MTIAKPAADRGLPTMIGFAAVCAHFELSPRGIQKMIDRGQFPVPIRVGRRLRWRVDQLNQWIEAGCPAIG